jgi:hypothetical protein
MNAVILKGAALRQPPLPQSGPRAKTIAHPCLRQNHHGSIAVNRVQNGRVRNVNIHNCAARKGSKVNHKQEHRCLRFFGLTSLNNGTSSGEGHNNTLCSLQWGAYWQARDCNSIQTSRTTVERCCVIPHAAAHIVETLRKLTFHVLAHVLYSLFSPSHVWSTQRDWLTGRRFTSEGSYAYMTPCSAENIVFWLSPKATRGLEPSSYRGALVSTLLHATVYLVTQFADCTGTDCKQNGIKTKNILWGHKEACPRMD